MTAIPPVSSGQHLECEDALAPAVVELSKVSKTFGRNNVLACVDLAVRAGQVVRVSGHNGSGKTVLLNILSGYTRPTGGAVRWAFITGRGDAWKLARAGVKRSFQTAGSLGSLSALQAMLVSSDAVRFGKLLVGFDDAPSRFQEASSQLAMWLPEIDANKPLDLLSVGQRRMVELVRCFLGPARLYVLDEPLAGLGPLFRFRVARLVEQAASAGAAVVYVEHDPEDLEVATSRRLILAEGILRDERPQ
jgi:ABC-type multidrug transport system ATPase subunit